MKNALIAACMLVTGVAAQGVRTGPQVATFFSDVDDTDQPYALYVPENYDPARRYPLVISLHAEGSSHRLNLRRVFGFSNLPGETDAEATRVFPKWRNVDFIVASPLARGTMGYQGIPEKDVYDVLNAIKKRLRIDENRVYLTGISMGGGGALWMGLTRPDVWAAVAAICPAAPEEASLLAANALNLPIRIFQGAADPVVRPERTREWAASLSGAGVRIEYDEFPDVKHNSWERAYRDESIFAWFEKFKRDPFPSRVRFSTSAYRYSKAYWVSIDELTPGSTATIDARFSGLNRVEVSTKGLTAFTLTVAGHPNAPRRTLTTVVDGSIVRTPDRTATFSLRDGRWQSRAGRPAVGLKRRGSEGPVSEALSSRHVYVYGTADHPSDAELAQRMETVQRAARWSTTRNPLLLSPRVIADRDLKPGESANLILFGTRETNSVIAGLPSLPMELNAGAADYGLTYVYPYGDQSVVICSGLPWWTGISRKRPESGHFLDSPAAAAADFGDYILFKGSRANTVASGRFDPAWRLPAAQAAAMKATGAVTIR